MRVIKVLIPPIIHGGETITIGGDVEDPQVGFARPENNQHRGQCYQHTCQFAAAQTRTHRADGRHIGIVAQQKDEQPTDAA